MPSNSSQSTTQRAAPAGEGHPIAKPKPSPKTKAATKHTQDSQASKSAKSSKKLPPVTPSRKNRGAVTAWSKARSSAPPQVTAGKKTKTPPKRSYVRSVAYTEKVQRRKEARLAVKEERQKQQKARRDAQKEAAAARAKARSEAQKRPREKYEKLTIHEKRFVLQYPETMKLSQRAAVEILVKFPRFRRLQQNCFHKFWFDVALHEKLLTNTREKYYKYVDEAINKAIQLLVDNDVAASLDVLCALLQGMHEDGLVPLPPSRSTVYRILKSRGYQSRVGTTLYHTEEEIAEALSDLTAQLRIFEHCRRLEYPCAASVAPFPRALLVNMDETAMRVWSNAHRKWRRGKPTLLDSTVSEKRTKAVKVKVMLSKAVEKQFVTCTVVVSADGQLPVDEFRRVAGQVEHQMEQVEPSEENAPAFASSCSSSSIASSSSATSTSSSGSSSGSSSSSSSSSSMEAPKKRNRAH